MTLPALVAMLTAVLGVLEPAPAAPPPAPAVAPPPAPRPPAPALELEPAGVPSSAVWDRVAGCESNNDWTADTGNGFLGGLQFTLASWRAVGGVGLPQYATRAEQIARADRLWATQGWPAWPVCSRRLGLR